MLESLKKYDYYFQLVFLVILFILFILFFFTKYTDAPINFFNINYLLGGFQLCSTVYWLIVDFKKLTTVRIIYTVFIFVLLTGVLTGGIHFDDPIFFLYALIVSPFSTIMYLLLTHEEWQNLKRNK